MASEPRLKEASINVRFGGKVSIVKYDVSADYSIGTSKTWTFPEDWDNDAIEKFIETERGILREQINERAQAEFDLLYEQSFMYDGDE